MPAVFPVLRTGSVGKYPLTMGPRFNTGMVQFMNDSEQRWAGSPSLQEFELVFTDIDGYDLNILLLFFDTVKGQQDNTWSITIEGNTYAACTLLTDFFQWTESNPNLFTVTLKVRQTQSSSTPYAVSANPVYFPQLNTAGLITQRPYKTGLEYSTTVVDMPAGQRWAFGWRGTGLTNFPTGPLGRFTLGYSTLADAERLALQAFFISMNGKCGLFTYLDPGGNLVPASENFADPSWTVVSVTPATGAADPFGGTLATTFTGTGVAPNGQIRVTVLPGGYATGMVINASAWVRLHGPFAGGIFVGFVDSGGAYVGGQYTVVPGSVWTRIEAVATVATNNPIQMELLGIGTGVAVDVFGAQCVPMPGAGGYVRTPGANGLHAKCRFDTDVFNPRIVGPNEATLTLPIVEYF